MSGAKTSFIQVEVSSSQLTNPCILNFCLFHSDSWKIWNLLKLTYQTATGWIQNNKRKISMFKIILFTHLKHFQMLFVLEVRWL